jgi:hypothetical protein
MLLAGARVIHEKNLRSDMCTDKELMLQVSMTDEAGRLPCDLDELDRLTRVTRHLLIFLLHIQDIPSAAAVQFWRSRK